MIPPLHGGQAGFLRVPARPIVQEKLSFEENDPGPPIAAPEGAAGFPGWHGPFLPRSDPLHRPETSK